MRRDIGGHAHGDPAAAIGQKIGKGCGQNHGLGERAVVVFPEIHRIFRQAFQKRLGDNGHPRLCVSARGGIVAVDISKIALTIHQRIAHVEILRQAGHGIIDRRIAMGMIIAHHIAGNLRRFAKSAVGSQLQFAHCIKNAAVNRFQTISCIRQSAVHDRRKRIGEITLANGPAERFSRFTWNGRGIVHLF